MCRPGLLTRSSFGRRQPASRRARGAKREKSLVGGLSPLAVSARSPGAARYFPCGRVREGRANTGALRGVSVVVERGSLAVSREGCCGGSGWSAVGFDSPR
jgi:hypothetical protein